MARRVHAGRTVGTERDRREAVRLIRLNFVVEGQTEEAFIRDILAPHLWGYEIFSSVRVFRGGGRYQRVKDYLHRWMRSDQNADARFTTMFDLYALPVGCPQPVERSPHTLQRVQNVEAAIANDIDDNRFVPYVQLHEFESLL